MQYCIPIVDQTNNYQLQERTQKITWFHVGTKSFLSFTDTSHHPCQTNKRWSSLEVATQASGNSKPCLMIPRVQERQGQSEAAVIWLQIATQLCGTKNLISSSGQDLARVQRQLHNIEQVTNQMCIIFRGCHLNTS